MKTIFELSAAEVAVTLETGTLKPFIDSVANIDKPAPALAPKKEKPAAKTTEPAPAPEVSGLTVEEVRARVAAVAGKGKLDEVKAILTKFDCADVSSMPAEKYEDFLAEVEAL